MRRPALIQGSGGSECCVSGAGELTFHLTSGVWDDVIFDSRDAGAGGSFLNPAGGLKTPPQAV